MIKMVLSPVIFRTVVLGIAKMENMKELGRIGVKSLIYSRSHQPWPCS
jgi:aerobic C4-dicarboxylate transport protein